MDDLDGLTLDGDLTAMDDLAELAHDEAQDNVEMASEDLSAALDEQMAHFEKRHKAKAKKAKPSKANRRRNIKAVKDFSDDAKRAQNREAQRLKRYKGDDDFDDIYDEDFDAEPGSPRAKRSAGAPKLVIKLGGDKVVKQSSTPSLKIKLGGGDDEDAAVVQTVADKPAEADDSSDDDDKDEPFVIDDDEEEEEDDDIVHTRTVDDTTVIDSDEGEGVDTHCRKLQVDPKVLHMDDSVNVPNEHGDVVVNVNRPEDEAEVRVAPELAPLIKPHQIGGVRFMWENCVGKLAYSGDDGYGCILAHAMGLGKTLQVVTFVEVFLRATQARTAVIITPVNTIGNWHAEFEKWLTSSSLPNIFVVSSRGKLADRQATVLDWHNEGGVLLVGYEMMRKLFVGDSYKARRRAKSAPEPKTEPHPDDAEMEEALLDPGPDLVVCDEGHRIKNDKTAISQLLKKIRTRRRVVLTGSPLQNNLEEYWCMVDFVRPSHLGTVEDFRNMFVNPIMNGQCIDSTDKDMRLMKYRSFVLQQLLATFVQRRDDSILRGSLPAKNEYTLSVRMSRWQAFLYYQLLEDAMQSKQGKLFRLFSTASLTWNHPDALFVTLLKAREQKDSSDLQAAAELGERQRAQAAHSATIKQLMAKLDAGDKNDISTLLKSWSIKSREVEDMAWGEAAFANYKYQPFKVEFGCKFHLLIKGVIEEAVRIGDKVLVFSQSIPGLDLLEMYLSRMEVPGTRDTWEKDVHYFRLDGKIDGANRRKLIDDFNDTTINDHCHLFLLSTRAGSLGINLTAANRVVIMDTSWNPSHDSQAVCRVYRYGQSRDCHIYRFVAAGTMEETIYNRQVNKLGLSARVVDIDKNPDRHFTADQLEELFTYRPPDGPDKTSPKIVDPSQGADPIMAKLCTEFKDLLVKTPFSHHSLLQDGDDVGLTNLEKDDAMKHYAREMTSAEEAAKASALRAQQVRANMAASSAAYASYSYPTKLGAGSAYRAPPGQATSHYGNGMTSMHHPNSAYHNPYGSTTPRTYASGSGYGGAGYGQQSAGYGQQSAASSTTMSSSHHALLEEQRRLQQQHAQMIQQQQMQRYAQQQQQMHHQVQRQPQPYTPRHHVYHQQSQHPQHPQGQQQQARTQQQHRQQYQQQPQPQQQPAQTTATAQANGDEEDDDWLNLDEPTGS